MTHVRLWSFSTTEVVLFHSCRETSFGHKGKVGAVESDSIVPGLNSQATEVLGTGGPLHT